MRVSSGQPLTSGQPLRSRSRAPSASGRRRTDSHSCTIIAATQMAPERCISGASVQFAMGWDTT